MSAALTSFGRLAIEDSEQVIAALDRRHGSPALFGERLAVKGGAQDCPYTYMQDMVAGEYRLPWESSVKVTDGTTCGFPVPTKEYQPPKAYEPPEKKYA